MSLSRFSAEDDDDDAARPITCDLARLATARGPTLEVALLVFCTSLPAYCIMTTQSLIRLLSLSTLFALIILYLAYL